MDGSLDLGGARALGIVVVGHVDHGKSTLIGRLLHETASLPAGKVAELEQMSEKRGMPFEWSFVLDAFQAERDQAVTIDTTQIRFASSKRPYVIIDAPGHREFLKNMISGAAAAEAAVLVIDAVEGVREQTRRHAYLLKLLGLGQVVVAVNKMDRVEHSQARFDAVSAEIISYLGDLGLAPSAIVPIAARHGDNLVVHAMRMPWYDGPTLVEALDRFAPASPPVDRALRLPVQDVYKFDERRIIVGRVETGRLEVGDTLLFSPSGRTATVRSIESWGRAEPPTSAQAGESVGFTLDEQIFVERGDIASHPQAAPALTHEFRATVFWLSERPLVEGQQLRLRLATDSAAATVESIERVIDTGTLAGRAATEVQRNDVAEVTLRSRELLALDEARLHPATGRFVLNDGYDTVAGGVINLEGQAEQRRPKSANLFAVGHLMSADARAWRNGHQGGVIWMTGLSGAGKSTLAMRVEQRLFAKGLQTYVLDGDNIRRGLNADLGFAPADRVENIRRVGEVAALFANAGLVAITAFISPYRADRDRARAAAANGQFHEIYVKADLATCEKRDPKGLYKRARAGEIPDFTGISAPYEAPVAPELVVDTAALTVDQAVDLIVDYLERTIVLRSGRRNGAALAG